MKVQSDSHQAGGDLTGTQTVSRKSKVLGLFDRAAKRAARAVKHGKVKSIPTSNQEMPGSLPLNPPITSSSVEPTSPQTSGLLNLPPELRALIWEFCFPPPQTQVQLIPYWKCSPACHMNLPLSLYLVCRSIYTELPCLFDKFRAMDFCFTIQGSFIGRFPRPGNRPPLDDDTDQKHFRKTMRIAERVRLVGSGHPVINTPDERVAVQRYYAGGQCALRVLEVQPIQWGCRILRHTVSSSLETIIVRSDVLHQLEFRLVRDDDGQGLSPDIEKTAAWVRRFDRWLLRLAWLRKLELEQERQNNVHNNSNNSQYSDGSDFEFVDYRPSRVALFIHRALIFLRLHRNRRRSL